VTTPRAAAPILVAAEGAVRAGVEEAAVRRPRI
jgi:hypothetical protein